MTETSIYQFISFLLQKRKSRVIRLVLDENDGDNYNTGSNTQVGPN